ncbi:MAG: hypothetical protein KGO96_10380 [Elusimicrobia bacterium]|nr:hypothetical protein [Elusimicrobiota bacterium]
MVDLTARQKKACRPIPTDLFSYRGDVKLFTAEASDLLDYTFCTYIKLQNPKTGGIVEFDLTEVDRDSDGDVAGWRFTGRGSHSDLRVLIIND